MTFDREGSPLHKFFLLFVIHSIPHQGLYASLGWQDDVHDASSKMIFLAKSHRRRTSASPARLLRVWLTLECWTRREGKTFTGLRRVGVQVEFVYMARNNSFVCYLPPVIFIGSRSWRRSVVECMALIAELQCYRVLLLSKYDGHYWPAMVSSSCLCVTHGEV